MLTVAEAARRLGRSIEQVRRYLREGRLPGRRLGQQWFIEEAAVASFYPPVQGPRRQIKESSAVMEAKRMTREEIEALIKRIDENREAIRKRLGGDIKLDVVEMLREDRESH